MKTPSDFRFQSIVVCQNRWPSDAWWDRLKARYGPQDELTELDGGTPTPNRPSVCDNCSDDNHGECEKPEQVHSTHYRRNCDPTETTVLECCCGSLRPGDFEVRS